MRTVSLVAAIVLGCTLVSQAGIVTLISDNFDSYADQAAFQAAWPNDTTKTSATLVTDQFYSAGKSIKTTNVTGDLPINYRNLGGNYAASDDTPLVTTFWLYNQTGATRQFNTIRDYTGAGYGDGSLAQMYAVGIYNSVTGAGEVYDGTKYQARVTNGTGSGWFNLNAAGAPSRSEGWHKFTIEIKSSTVNFYVDDILGRSLGRGTVTTGFDSFVIGSALTSGKPAWTDDVAVRLVPEPATLVLLGFGGLFLRRRRA